MTNLDPETKARIEAEERYRQEVRANAPTQPAPTLQATAPKRKAGCGTWIAVGVGIFVALGVIGAMMGGSETTAPTAASTPTPAAAAAASPNTTTGAEASAEVAPSAGDGTLNADGSINIGVWNISDVTWSRTNQVGGEFGENAGEGETFIQVKMTLKNTTKETQSYSSLIDPPQLILTDGSLIDSDLMLSGGQVIDGQIAPGLKRSGGYGFRVPADKASGMKFQVQFFGGKRAVVALAD